MRELSAQLTEGEILNSQIYIFAHTAKIAVNSFRSHGVIFLLSILAKGIFSLLYSFIFSPPVTFGDSPLVRGGLWCGANLLDKFMFCELFEADPIEIGQNPFSVCNLPCFVL